jgi:hypothetical protein
MDSSDLSTARPSGDLAKQRGTTLFHQDSKTKEWSAWDRDADNKKGGWVSTSHEDVTSYLGGKMSE